MKKTILIIIIILLVAVVLVAIYFRQKPGVTKEYISQRFLQLKQAYQAKLDQGYDLTEVLNYGKQALESFNQGDYQLADKLLNLAFDALGKAKIPPEPIKQCPICPLPSEWSDCKDGKQTRTSYKCSAETDYKCQTYIEEGSCESPEEFPIDRAGLVNSLEYFRQKGFRDEQAASEYVIIKAWLQSPIDNKQEIINYLDSKQWDDGGWATWGGEPGKRPMTSRAVLLAYFILDAKPNRTLDPFFENWDTWEEARNYPISPEKDLIWSRMDKYHLVFSWVEYYKQYPPWIEQLWDFYEDTRSQDDWTTSIETHERTHILYSYLIARRDYPNLDGIIDATLREQKEDGSWLSLPETAIQIHLFKSIMLLYPDYRTSEMEASIEKAKHMFTDNYRTTIIDGKPHGYFVHPITGEVLFEGEIENIFLLTFGAVLSSLTEGDVDPLFNKLYQSLLK